MGLGKTLQTLALICHAQAGRARRARRSSSSRRPASCPNWAAEAARFAPGPDRSSPITDTLRRRGQDAGRGRRRRRRRGHLVHAVPARRRRLRARSTWSGLVLDEAQFVKNHQSKVYQCARRLPAPFKLAITGTPMENNLMELWSLLSITAPGLFPSPTRFREYYARPIEKRRRRRAAGAAAAPDQAAGQAPHQGAGGRRPAARSRSRCSRSSSHPRHRTDLRARTCSASGRRCSACSTTSTATGSRSCARSPCCASSACTPAWSTTSTRDLGRAQDRRAARAARRGGRRRAPGAGVQPVHRLPRARSASGSTPPASTYCYLDGTHPRPARRSSQRFKDGDGPGVPDQPQGRRLRAQPDRGRLLLPARPVVEPGDRGAGGRPHAPHRPDPQRHGLPADRPRHHRGEGDGAGEAQGGAVRRRHGRRRRRSAPRSTADDIRALVS